jgi:hypothetical protein
MFWTERVGKIWDTETFAFVTDPRDKSFFSAGFRELTDTRLGKEESAASPHHVCFWSDAHGEYVRNSFEKLEDGR